MKFYLALIVFFPLSFFCFFTVQRVVATFTRGMKEEITLLLLDWMALMEAKGIFILRLQDLAS